MTFEPFSLRKYLFIMTLTVSIKQCEKVNLFKPNTPMRQRHRFVSHSPYCPVVRLNGPRAYIRTPLYSNILFEDCVLNILTKINRKNKHNLKKAVELVWANQYLEVNLWNIVYMRQKFTDFAG